MLLLLGVQSGSKRQSSIGRSPSGLPEVRGMDRDGPALDKKVKFAVCSSQCMELLPLKLRKWAWSDGRVQCNRHMPYMHALV